MSALPLEGVRIADFSWVHAGPFATMILAEMGAEVIKIETSKRLDIVRQLPPMADRVGGINRSGYFNAVNRGKRSCTLDLQTAAGRALACDLIRVSDVVVENFSPGVLDRLGLGYASLREVRPDIILVSISGYGATGPDRHYVAYGTPLTAFSGLVMLHGYPGGEPQSMNLAWPDPVAGYTAALAILAALLHRAETGEGQFIDLAQAEAAIAFLGDQIAETTMNGRQPPRRGNEEVGAAPHGIYPCAGQDRWIAIAVTDETAWHGLRAALRDPDLEDDAFADPFQRWERRADLDRIVERWTRQRSPEEAFHWLQTHGVPAAPAATCADLASDPHLHARAFFGIDHHPETGPRQMAGLPWVFGSLPRRIGAPAPRLGADTEWVLGALLGLDRARIAQLIAERVIA
ncbi:MAG: CoA transferase [Chloroflexota bacterium]|nr:CoA transferase [Dehalococcoidia bacterium]MDW8254249.1 CoA transferase [Chloroflexota bacterium]